MILCVWQPQWILSLARGRARSLGLSSLLASLLAVGPVQAKPPTVPVQAKPPTVPVQAKPPTFPVQAKPPAASLLPLSAEEEGSAWALRERKLLERGTLEGGIGLLHTQHAQSSAAGQFRLGVVGRYAQSNSLCTSDFPCAPQLLTSDPLKRTEGSLFFGVTPFVGRAGFLEVYGSLFFSSTASEVNRVFQVLGDPTLGMRWGLPLGRGGVHLGLLVESSLHSAPGQQGPAWQGTSGRAGPLLTWDLRELQAKVPLRFSANGFYVLNNRPETLDASRQKGLSRFERVALGLDLLDSVHLHGGLEAFVWQERIRPFVEYSTAIPVNFRHQYVCVSNNAHADACLTASPLAPSTLTVGSTFFLSKRGFGITPAVEIGMFGSKTFVSEMMPILPWKASIGFGWAYEPQDPPPQVRVVETRLPAPPQGVLAGFVHAKGGADGVPTQAGAGAAPGVQVGTPGIPGAVVRWVTHPTLTSFATGDTGRFVTQPLEPGLYRFAVRAEGYKEGECQATVPPAGLQAPLAVDCPLEPLPKGALLWGTVLHLSTKQPVEGVNLTLSNTEGYKISAVSDSKGGFRFEGVPAGVVTLLSEASGFLLWAQRNELKVREEQFVDVQMQPMAKEALVKVDSKEIVMRKQIQFLISSAEIEPASFALLNELADAFLRHPEIRKVEVQGHTDTSGRADLNMSLSEQRAAAVRDWLVANGVAPERLEAKGYGQTSPRFSNDNAANRAKNRRVQMIIWQ